MEVNRGSLSGRFLGYSLTRIRLTPTARNDMWRKRANRANEQQVSVLTCRGLHCKPAVPMLFSCPNVDRNETFGAAPSGGRAMRAPTQLRKTMIKNRCFHCSHNFPLMNSISRNADVTITPDVKYASQKTRGEISSEVNFGFLSRRFLD